MGVELTSFCIVVALITTKHIVPIAILGIMYMALRKHESILEMHGLQSPLPD